MLQQRTAPTRQDVARGSLWGPRVGQQKGTFRPVPVVNVMVQEAAHTAPRPQYHDMDERESHVAHLAHGHGNPQNPQNPSALRETSATAPHSTSTSTPRRAHARRTRAGQSHAPGPCLAYRAHRLVEHRLRCCLHSAVTREHARGRAEAGGGDAPLQSRVALLSSARVPRRAAAPVPSRGVWAGVRSFSGVLWAVPSFVLLGAKSNNV